MNPVPDYFARMRFPFPLIHNVLAPYIRFVAATAILSAALVGCAEPPPAEFRINLEGRNAGEIRDREKEAISEALARLFGTADEPKLPAGTGLDLDLVRRAAGPYREEDGKVVSGLFRRHCAECHGVSGDGAGKRAESLDPYPRDYRLGVFKYTSTHSGGKPIDADLMRTLEKGVPGTAMPSFAKLDESARRALVEYVKYLAIRGETEHYLVRLVLDEDEYLPLDMRIVKEEGLEPVTAMWEAAPSMGIVPPEPIDPGDRQRMAASIAAGRTLYLAEKADCVRCHGEDGSGEGEEEELIDDWNKPKKGVTPERTAELAELYRLPLQEMKPRNFREGVFQGGSRPKDLFWRIHVGIKGTPMPGIGAAPGVHGVFTDEQIRDMVNYIQSLSRE